MTFSTELKEFENIIVVPFSELLDNPRGMSFHRGGPIFPAWESQLEVRYCRGGKPSDELPASPSEYRKLDADLLWCGPITLHYGHMISDFLMRLPYYLNEFTEDKKLCFAVHPRTGIKTVWELPQWLRDIFQWFKIPLSNVVIVSEAVKVSKLIVAPQVEQAGVPTNKADYFNVLESFASLNLDTYCKQGGKYYVSRAAMKHGKIAGEAYLEDIFSSLGFKVMRPESISVLEQLRIYSQADELVFSEGSALHTLQLLGRIKARVTILNRRTGTKLAVNFLKERIKSLEYLDIGTLVFGLNVAGKDCPETGITIPDWDLLRDELARLFNSQIFVDKCFAKALVEKDVKKWFEAEKSSQRARVAGSLEKITKGLADVNVDISD
ncbi:glycosyltransferase family 61 protein [Alteromonas mediterranea]|uniref:glycosyltransferase 61 family protein n=1 Tax=Alteromonas mediterranea TaxID=314275 RepID=UPI001130009C|nr:glycosyltransferase family 61 protein [Alteromonas mediterranea]QDG39808.1 glycosyltransferase family 61 protein [Alteromonas mediterranea]